MSTSPCQAFGLPTCVSLVKTRSLKSSQHVQRIQSAEPHPTSISTTSAIPDLPGTRMPWGREPWIFRLASASDFQSCIFHRKGWPLRTLSFFPQSCEGQRGGLDLPAATDRHFAALRPLRRLDRLVLARRCWPLSCRAPFCWFILAEFRAIFNSIPPLRNRLCSTYVYQPRSPFSSFVSI